MNSLFLTTLLSQLRQIANYPNVLNIPFNANRASQIREDILSVAKDVEKREPIVASQLIRAKDVLFYTNQFGQPLLNPYALGEIIFGLNYLDRKKQAQSNYPDPEKTQWAHIHPLIQKASKKLFVDGSYANAAVDAYIEINSRVKKLFHKLRPNDPVPDGKDVMNKVFSINNPMIQFCDLTDDTGKNTRLGYMEMLAGAMSALRNPKAHSNDVVISKEEAMRRLMYASMLMYKIDEGVKYSNITE